MREYDIRSELLFMSESDPTRPKMFRTCVATESFEDRSLDVSTCEQPLFVSGTVECFKHALW